jgi:C4-dicarboxylate transporter DctM subunit
MLIPPSVLMIVWGLLTERSIGQIFLAGVFPGILLLGLFVTYVLVVAMLRPNLVGENKELSELNALTDNSSPPPSATQVWSSAFGIIFVVVAVLGGIWFGIFTPTEGAGAGAFIALIMAIAKGLRVREIIDAILSVGRTSAPILLLLVSAALYSRTLAMTGVSTAIQDAFLGTNMLPWMIIATMVGIWFLLGMVIDSISIMLLTVTIFEPIAVTLGYDPIAFAIVGILAIEAGLLTPPFGLLVYTVKAAIQDEGDDISIMQIFRSSTPYWIIMLVGIIAISSYPQIATYLPNLMF